MINTCKRGHPKKAGICKKCRDVWSVWRYIHKYSDVSLDEFHKAFLSVSHLDKRNFNLENDKDKTIFVMYLPDEFVYLKTYIYKEKTTVQIIKKSDGKIMRLLPTRLRV